MHGPRASFSIKVYVDPAKTIDRYRWDISKGDIVIKVSWLTYAKKIEAETAANKALSSIKAKRL